MSTFYGVDISMWSGEGLPDLNPFGRLVTGRTLLAQCILNRLFNDRGSYLQSPSFGMNMLRYYNASSNEIQPAAIAAETKIEVSKDDRVSDVETQCEFTNGKLILRVRVFPNEEGPFELVMTLVQATQKLEVTFNDSNA